jgi:hypothetical protein
MADMYQDGTGTFEFEGEPKLSIIAASLMRLLATYDDNTGFYRQESQSIDDGDIRDAILDVLLPDYPESGNALDAEPFLELLVSKGFMLAPSYQELVRSDYAQPLDVALAIKNDPESNLRAVSYEEALYCSKPRAGEFGGYGAFMSDLVVLHCSTTQAIQSTEYLDRALRGHGNVTAETVVSGAITEIFGRILDPLVRERIARSLLIGEALVMVEDSIVNDRDLPEEEGT